ncbi:MAG: ATP-grasp domain-containing protein [Desulfobacterales bacterium]|nr:ATP-grasp domain-containing protein [Desulfobacterales bacterium]MCP4163520.1 ATP-grasp domain-containing protein [Deltaproteobacteria bacterium]
MDKTEKPIIALEPYLKRSDKVLTFSVKPNFSDYSSEEAKLIKNADKIYFPSTFYAELFDAMGKEIFPSYHTYKYALDKIKQTALFNLLDIPHPRTRVFYGKRQKKTILDYFDFPFVAKIPRGSSMGDGVYLIENRKDLDEYLENVTPAYIQEFIESNRDIRIVVIGDRVAISYFKISKAGEFRNNIAKGATYSFDNIPKEALDLALETAKKCKWDNVGIDIICNSNNYYVLEANMKYGIKGFKERGINYYKYLIDLVETNQI